MQDQDRMTYTYMRKHPRAQLRLPVRIRWHGLIGMRLEMTETIEVSREGLLVHRDEACEVPSRAWVAFPFDPSTGAAVQPETPARVVRVEREANGSFRVAMQLENASREGVRGPGQERRASPRVPFALPIFVRPAGAPWPEESMTQDVSRAGVRFETAHIYGPGDAVMAKIPWAEWSKAGEIPGRVVRVESIRERPAPLADPDGGMSGIYTSVSVRWTDPGPNGAAQSLGRPARI